MSQTLEPSGSEKQTAVTFSIFISWAKLRRQNSQEMQEKGKQINLFFSTTLYIGKNMKKEFP